MITSQVTETVIYNILMTKKTPGNEHFRFVQDAALLTSKEKETKSVTSVIQACPLFLYKGCLHVNSRCNVTSRVSQKTFDPVLPVSQTVTVNTVILCRLSSSA